MAINNSFILSFPFGMMINVMREWTRSKYVGLCQFEQMGVGIPQVVPDIGGFKEFCLPNNSILVKPSVRYYVPNGFSPVGGEAHACQPHDVCVAMEEYLLNSEKRVEHGKKARESVLEYTWSKSCETLIKRLRAVLEDDC